MPEIPKVAIACQGGGSHAAFAAGVLRHLLRPDQRERFRLVGLSGTSGGAVCVALAWRGLLGKGADEASQRLMDFWRDLEVHDLADEAFNFFGLLWARSPITMEVSPYDYPPIAETKMRQLLEKHLDLHGIASVPAARRARPTLLIGATDVLNGERLIFDGERLTVDEILASAAVPPLFRAVRAGGTLCWDGLFSTNPPIRELTNLPDKVDEIWVVQINPQVRKTEPTRAKDIVDRRNELGGNLSLGQELYFVQKVNEMRAASDTLRDRYRPIQVRMVQLDDDTLDYPSKLDRRSELIERLLRCGEERAEWFFDERSDWPRPGTAPPKSRWARGRPPT